ncbi:hypothetical protein K469DRAFT_688664 [Zopfia rhizophila CBS 207.26]|uniref:Uncharacterized protein n=1 Tax=Zopfia rhizophila CBS 207.26 TaxID=1314779 RepID=A0A6A6E458_9PEZI|nr:hypothetical protein K469DRAFT_688664 [Zopfia rhizophila CBS 207.26]
MHRRILYPACLRRIAQWMRNREYHDRVLWASVLVPLAMYNLDKVLLSLRIDFTRMVPVGKYMSESSNPDRRVTQHRQGHKNLEYGPSLYTLTLYSEPIDLEHLWC